jgi:hypothetical protein
VKIVSGLHKYNSGFKTEQEDKGSTTTFWGVINPFVGYLFHVDTGIQYFDFHWRGWNLTNEELLSVVPKRNECNLP